jgi:hypothetical protein
VRHQVIIFTHVDSLVDLVVVLIGAKAHSLVELVICIHRLNQVLAKIDFQSAYPEGSGQDSHRGGRAVVDIKGDDEACNDAKVLGELKFCPAFRAIESTGETSIAVDKNVFGGSVFIVAELMPRFED